MEQVQQKAHAKINLTLDVQGKRNDGFHNVEMVMQAIELHDLVTIKTLDEGISITSNSGAIPLNENNLVFKAARALMQVTGRESGLLINIQKNIPVAAGLAGGSTDAAATLLGLNKLLGLNLSLKELMDIGASIGSDIPFCLTGGTALAKGRGEIVEPQPPLSPKWLILAKPTIEVSTAEVYKNFNSQKVQERPDNQAMINAIAQDDYVGVETNLVNVLESVTLTMHPEVQKIKDLMCRYGIKKPLMSGSGPTVFGFVEDKDKAERISAELKGHVPIVIITHTV